MKTIHLRLSWNWYWIEKQYCWESRCIKTWGLYLLLLVVTAWICTTHNDKLEKLVTSLRMCVVLCVYHQDVTTHAQDIGPLGTSPGYLVRVTIHGGSSEKQRSIYRLAAAIASCCLSVAPWFSFILPFSPKALIQEKCSFMAFSVPLWQLSKTTWERHFFLVRLVCRPANFGI